MDLRVVSFRFLIKFFSGFRSGSFLPISSRFLSYFWCHICSHVFHRLLSRVAVLGFLVPLLTFLLVIYYRAAVSKSLTPEGGTKNTNKWGVLEHFSVCFVGFQNPVVVSFSNQIKKWAYNLIQKKSEIADTMCDRVCSKMPEKLVVVNLSKFEVFVSNTHSVLGSHGSQVSRSLICKPDRKIGSNGTILKHVTLKTNENTLRIVVVFFGKPVLLSPFFSSRSKCFFFGEIFFLSNALNALGIFLWPVEFFFGGKIFLFWFVYLIFLFLPFVGAAAKREQLDACIIAQLGCITETPCDGDDIVRILPDAALVAPGVRRAKNIARFNAQKILSLFLKRKKRGSIQCKKNAGALLKPNKFCG